MMVLQFLGYRSFEEQATGTGIIERLIFSSRERECCDLGLRCLSKEMWRSPNRKLGKLMLPMLHSNGLVRLVDSLTSLMRDVVQSEAFSMQRRVEDDFQQYH